MEDLEYLSQKAVEHAKKKAPKHFHLLDVYLSLFLVNTSKPASGGSLRFFSKVVEVDDVVV